MKPKALMLSAAVLLGGTAVAFAQANSPPTVTPSSPAMTQHSKESPTTPATPAVKSAGSTAARSTNTKAATAETKSATTQMKTARMAIPRKANRREEMAERGAQRRDSGDPATTALNLLEEHGYHDFSTFQRAGQDYEIKTKKNGSPLTVLVNPYTKTVQTQG